MNFNLITIDLLNYIFITLHVQRVLHVSSKVKFHGFNKGEKGNLSFCSLWWVLEEKVP